MAKEKALFTITFSPVQPFIAEARRSSDLFVGSQLLVKLSKALLDAVEKADSTLIYPIKGTQDTPNKIVALVNWADCEDIYDYAETAFYQQWKDLAAAARSKLESYIGKQGDSIWQKIWNTLYERGRLFQIYWAAVRVEVDEEDNILNYYEKNKELEQLLSSIKRTRVFQQCTEQGLKDSLSGYRQALRTQNKNANAYWKSVSASKSVFASRLRPDGRERLDPIGVIKRFQPVDDYPCYPFLGFPSTSSVASYDYLVMCENDPETAKLVKDYSQKITALLPNTEQPGRAGPFPVFKQTENRIFQQDGDFFYDESMTKYYLKHNYQREIDESAYKNSVASLKKLQKAVGKPSPYYALMVMDGDSMGKNINSLVREHPYPLKAHQEFSAKISEFSHEAQQLIQEEDTQGFMIYNGGDDVVAMAPLSKIFALAHALHQTYERIVNYKKPGTGEVENCRVSAGIVIAHHREPLGYVIERARAAEHAAKTSRPEKNIVCVEFLKRSGPPRIMLSGWGELNPDNGLFAEIQTLIMKKVLSSKFAFDLAFFDDQLPESNDLFESNLKLLLRRHRSAKDGMPEEKVLSLARSIRQWGASLPIKPEEPIRQAKEISGWMILARFIAQGGKE